MPKLALRNNAEKVFFCDPKCHRHELDYAGKVPAQKSGRVAVGTGVFLSS